MIKISWLIETNIATAWYNKMCLRIADNTLFTVVRTENQQNQLSYMF